MKDHWGDRRSGIDRGPRSGQVEPSLGRSSAALQVNLGLGLGTIKSIEISVEAAITTLLRFGKDPGKVWDWPIESGNRPLRVRLGQGWQHELALMETDLDWRAQDLWITLCTMQALIFLVKQWSPQVCSLRITAR